MRQNPTHRALRGGSPVVTPLRRTALALIAAVMVVAVALLVIGWIGSSVRRATVGAGDLAPVAIAVTLLMALGAWWGKGHEGAAAEVSTSGQAAAAADQLAKEMAAGWLGEAASRRINQNPAVVRWRWGADDLAGPRMDVATAPAPGTGPPPLPDLGRPGQLLGSGGVTRLHDEVYARL